MPDPDLVERIAESTGLSGAEAARVIDDVLAWHREPLADYVRRRHADLQMHGVRNDAAFERIAVDLRTRLVAAPPLSIRQLRRLVYG